jgi:hypothetical protein
LEFGEGDGVIERWERGVEFLEYEFHFWGVVDESEEVELVYSCSGVSRVIEEKVEKK